MQGKSVAIVTGASQGIGRATAVRLARDFEAVVLTARQEDELRNTAAAVESAGGEPRARLTIRTRWLTAPLFGWMAAKSKGSRMQRRR
jgi:NAD(P)-dependent dehydrogenase (short-subunit alcohol dehydrogenase family)